MSARSAIDEAHVTGDIDTADIKTGISRAVDKDIYGSWQRILNWRSGCQSLPNRYLRSSLIPRRFSEP